MIQLLKSLRPEIQPENPWASDKLDRQKTAEYLTPIVASVRQPFVIALDAPFGMGKSFFLEAWRHSLRQQGFETVYFNAWETDFSSNALFAFMASLKRQLQDAAPGKTKIAARFSRLTKAAAGFARHHAAPIVAKGIVRKIVGSDTVKEIAEAISVSENEMVSLAESLTKEGLKAQEMAEAALENFRKYLEEIINEMVGQRAEEAKRKILIFVDELDRCRPPYAIQVLEQIKHLFSVRGLVFVLAVDMRQIKGAISSVYGSDVDATGYIRRFIDWHFHMPRPSYRSFAVYLCERFDLESAPSFRPNHTLTRLGALAQWFAWFAEGLSLSLRQQEQCFTVINLAVRALPKGEAPLSPVTALLVALREGAPDLYRSCCLQDPDIEAVTSSLGARMTGIDFEEWGSWDSVKALIHSWLLDSQSFGRLHTRLDELTRDYNSLQRDPTRHEDLRNVEREREYLTNVRSHYSEVRGFGTSRRTVCRVVYERLEGAALFAGQ